MTAFIETPPVPFWECKQIGHWDSFKTIFFGTSSVLSRIIGFLACMDEH